MKLSRPNLENARIYTIAAVTNLGGFYLGYDNGLIGGVLALDSFKRSFGLDKLSPGEFASVSGNIVSILQLGSLAGAVLIGPITQRIGRRPALIFTNFIYIVGSILQTLAGVNGSQALAILYAGRFIGGMGVGAISMLLPTYISENAPKEIRGRCSGMIQVFIVVGLALANWINYAVIRTIPVSQKQWRIPFGVQIIPGALLFGAMFFMNESPRWLAEHRSEGEAKRSLAWARGFRVDDPRIKTEIDEIMLSLEEEKVLAQSSSWRVIREIAHSKSLRWRFIIGNYIQVGQMFTGTNAINYYSPLIFHTIGISGTEADLLATGVYGIVKIVVSSLCLLISIEQLGRRRSLIFGGIGQAITMIIVGIVVKLVPPTVAGAKVHPESYAAIVSIYVYITFYNLSWGPVVWVLTGELFPNHVRSFCVAACLGVQWLANYTIAKITPLMVNSMGFGMFLFFGGCCIGNAIFIALTLPETKGHSLEAIGALFGDPPLESPSSAVESTGEFQTVSERKSERLSSPSSIKDSH